MLREWASGDVDALDALIPIVYGELRLMAGTSLRHERDPTTSPTSLVHDLFLRLVEGKRVHWQDRGHFFGIASRILRQLLVGRARHRKALKRGGNVAIVGLSDFLPSGAREGGQWEDGIDLLALDQALVRLGEMDPAKARLVELRYFGGLTMEDAAAAMDISLSSAKRHWGVSRRWLYREMTATEVSTGQE